MTMPGNIEGGFTSMCIEKDALLFKMTHGRTIIVPKKKQIEEGHSKLGSQQIGFYCFVSGSLSRGGFRGQKSPSKDNFWTLECLPPKTAGESEGFWAPHPVLLHPRLPPGPTGPWSLTMAGAMPMDPWPRPWQKKSTNRNS